MQFASGFHTHFCNFYQNGMGITSIYEKKKIPNNLDLQLGGNNVING
jgi:hypothetical protein